MTAAKNWEKKKRLYVCFGDQTSKQWRIHVCLEIDFGKILGFKMAISKKSSTLENAPPPCPKVVEYASECSGVHFVASIFPKSSCAFNGKFKQINSSVHASRKRKFAFGLFLHVLD